MRLFAIGADVAHLFVEDVEVKLNPLQTERKSARHEHFPALHGLRGMLCLLMVTFHTFIHISIFLTKEQIEPLRYHAGILRASWGGMSLVDIFFVLSGFFLALPLLHAQHPEQISLKHFYFKRFIVGIYPVYSAALLLYCFVIAPNGLYDIHQSYMAHLIRPQIQEVFPDATAVPSLCFISPINLLFLNNLIPFGGCMGHTWSLAIQVRAASARCSVVFNVIALANAFGNF